MSSAPNATPTSSASDHPFDFALAEYSKYTGQDLRNHQLVAAIDGQEVLSIFREKSQAFEEFSNGDPKLIEFLEPIVSKLHAIGRSAALHAGAALVSPTQFHTPSPTYFNAYF